MEWNVKIQCKVVRNLMIIFQRMEAVKTIQSWVDYQVQIYWHNLNYFHHKLMRIQEEWVKEGLLNKLFIFCINRPKLIKKRNNYCRMKLNNN